MTTIVKKARAIQTSQEDGDLIITTSVGTIRVNPNLLSKEVRDAALLHGLKQKICDAAAKDAGTSITEKFSAMQAVYEHLADGSWNGRRSTGEMTTATLIVQALARAYGKSLEWAEGRITARMDFKEQDRKTTLKEFAGTKEVIRALAEIKAERAKGSLNADDLLGEMDAEDDSAV